MIAGDRLSGFWCCLSWFTALAVGPAVSAQDRPEVPPEAKAGPAEKLEARLRGIEEKLDRLLRELEALRAKGAPAAPGREGGRSPGEEEVAAFPVGKPASLSSPANRSWNRNPRRERAVGGAVRS